MKLTLINQKPETEGVITFQFQPQEPTTWQPGQYMHYVMEQDDSDDRGTERWFTIASAPFQKFIQITTRYDGQRVSSFKKALQAMDPGAAIEADGPKGKFVLQEGDHRHIFIAGGIGITPFRSMLAQMDHDGSVPDIELLYANRDQDFIFGEELERIAAAHPSLKITKFVDKHIEAVDLQTYLTDDSNFFYISGPEPMVESYDELLKSLGVPEERIKNDYFPGYQQA